MNAIDRPGTFRGKVTDHGVSETRNGFPQWVATIQALEFYDANGELTGNHEPGYVAWGDFDQDITAYLVLFTTDNKSETGWKECLNAKQIKKVFGWNGLDFQGLADLKTSETLILFRVDDHEYNGQKSLQVSWIDTADANPVKQLPKFDATKLAGLTAKLGGALQGTTVAAVPAKAPASAKVKAPPKSQKAKAPATNPPPVAGTTPTTVVAPAVPTVVTPTAPATIETKDSAWASVSELKQKDITDEKLAEVWIAEATKIGKAEDAFTSADWLTVKNAVLAQVSVF
jgi:hypothetical protein